MLLALGRRACALHIHNYLGSCVLYISPFLVLLALLGLRSQERRCIDASVLTTGVPVCACTLKVQWACSVP